MRLFAIEHFHHFAYMAIGVAMLGFGASGTLVAGLGDRASGFGERWWLRAATLTPLALIAAPALAHLIELDATRLAWDAGQWLRVGAVYAILAVPFATGALAMLCALTMAGDRPGALYGASFLGAALGAGLALGILWIAAPAPALALPAVVAAPAALLVARGAWRWTPAAVALAAVAVPPWPATVTPYKGLPQVEAFPDSRRVAERTNPVGWTVAIRAPAFRYAPGLSLGYHGSFPAQTALFLDGQLAGAAADWGAQPGALELFGWLPSAVAYAVGPRERVLVIGAGDGIEAWSALAHGAARVTAVELSSDLVRLVRRLSVPSLAADERVTWVVGDARTFVARTRERFDLILLGPGGGLATTAAGVHALNEDFLHTVEAYAAYLTRLDADGMLAVTRWVTVPPRASVRVILTAAEALRRVRPEAARGLAVVRGWGTATVLVKPSGFDAPDVDRLRAWGTARGFDLDWYPGLAAPLAGSHALDDPVLFRAAAAAAAGVAAARRFADAYAFDVRPATDQRPYPHHFLRGRSAGTFLRHARGEWLPFAEWGYLALFATLAQSAVLAALLLTLPALVRRDSGVLPPGRVAAYFGAIGFGYMAAEIAAIQVLSLLLGHPVFGVAATLGILLAWSGAGSAWSDRFPVWYGRPVAATIAVLLALAAGLLIPLAHAFAGAAPVARVAVALLELAPLALLMGVPFPLGVRAVAGPERGRVAWAWAANGFASVVGAPLAALVALEWGSTVLLVGAALAYAAAGLVTPGRRPGVSPPEQASV